MEAKKSDNPNSSHEKIGEGEFNSIKSWIEKYGEDNTLGRGSFKTAYSDEYKELLNIIDTSKNEHSMYQKRKSEKIIRGIKLYK
mgnify:CR=1 FL=1